MPQPITKIVPNPHVQLNPDVLLDKPHFALLVCKIFAIWARIEQALTVLLVRVLGANSAPAIAIYSTLTAQHLQNRALDAAAKAALPDDDYQIFEAAISVVDSSQTPRNHLAHWSWGVCKERPDLLALADPKMLSTRDIRVFKHFHEKDPSERDQQTTLSLIQFEKSRILAYSIQDLERAVRDLEQAQTVIKHLVDYLDPIVSEGLYAHLPQFARTRSEIRVSALQKLNEQRLFREALARIRAARQTSSQQPSG